MGLQCSVSPKLKYLFLFENPNQRPLDIKLCSITSAFGGSLSPTYPLIVQSRYTLPLYICIPRISHTSLKSFILNVIR